jgi:hypothetical protein
MGIVQTFSRDADFESFKRLRDAASKLLVAIEAIVVVVPVKGAKQMSVDETFRVAKDADRRS